MKDLSLFLLKNTMTAKMRKGFKSFCNGDGSTSTLNQQKMKRSEEVDNFILASSADGERSLLMENAEKTKHDDKHEATTLEEMIMQLELEEKMARRKEEEFSTGERSRMLQQQRRMSCVNSSDILRSARNALNQYPRFSLDGKDAMYRSSFRNFGAPVENVDVNISGGTRRNTTNKYKSSCSCSCRICRYNHQYSYRVLKKNDERQLCSCSHVDFRGISRGGGGQQLQEAKLTADQRCSVAWCKPGVVAKLMGLEAMPIPVLHRMNNDTNNNNKMMTRRRLSTSSAVDDNFKKQNQLPRNREREAAVRIDSHNDNSAGFNKRPGTSDKNYYLNPPHSRITDNHIMIRKHVPMEGVTEFDEPGWPLRRRFL